MNCKYHIIAFTVSICFFFFHCSKDTSIRGQVDIRIENLSNYDFENVIVEPRDGQVRYGDINSGELSEYKEYDFVYSVEYISLNIDGSEFVIQPIDWIGESPLMDGKYTYLIDADSTDQRIGRLSLELRAG